MVGDGRKMGFWVEYKDDDIRTLLRLHAAASKLKRRPQECTRTLGQDIWDDTNALMGVLRRHGYDFKA